MLRSRVFAIWRRPLASLLTLLFALSIAGFGVPCAHVGLATATSGDAHHGGSHQGMSHRKPVSNEPPETPSQHHAPAGCVVLMSCSAAVSALVAPIIESATSVPLAAMPTGPMLQNSIIDRDVESPPPRR